MKISATTVAHSLSPQGIPLWTGLIVLPRFILAELNTHRMLSKNSASSRAIPTHKLLKMVEENPFIPIAWQKEHKGMQGTEYFTDSFGNTQNWLFAKKQATSAAKIMIDNGVTKQIANRLLEPFMWHTVLISGTEWENFFELRCPQYSISGTNDSTLYRSRKDATIMYPRLSKLSEIEWLEENKGQAEIHMMALAEAIWDAMNESEPKQLQAGEWHIPFEDKIDDTNTFGIMERVRISTAMAARTSYTVVGDEKIVSYDTLVGIHDKMAVQVPFHASPFEHCSKAMDDAEHKKYAKSSIDGTESQVIEFGWCRNYRGFIQYRHLLESGIQM